MGMTQPGMTEPQRKLVEDHIWLARQIARSYGRMVPPSVEVDDMQQAGCEGLIDAAMRFDPTRGLQFKVFAVYRVRGAIADYLRSLDHIPKAQRRRIKDNLDAEGRVASVPLEELPGELRSTDMSPEHAVMAIEFSEQLRHLIRGLSKREQTVVRKYYYEEKQMAEVGVEMGVNESRISHIHTAMVKKMGRDPAFMKLKDVLRHALAARLLRGVGSVALALLAVAFALPAQSPLDLKPKACAGDTVQLVATVPLSAGATTVPVPVCVALGPGLTLNTSVSPPRLEATAAPTVAVPRAVVQKLTLPGNMPSSNTTTMYVLSNTPAPGTAIAMAFRSARIGGDVVDFVTPGGGANPKAIEITVPNYRPFTSADTLTLLYWTLDPLDPQ